MRQLKITKSITQREELSLEKYLQEISKVDLLTIDDEISLAKKIRAGDDEALDKLVKANLRFVVSVAKQYRLKGLSLNDLINEGNVGLVKAARKYDETKGFKFISYAVWWIRQSIMLALSTNQRLIRLPLNKVGDYNKINKQLSLLEQKFEREPTIDELSEVMEMPVEDIEEILIASKQKISLDAPFDVGNDESGGASSLVDILSNGDEPMDKPLSYVNSLQIEIERSLNTLTSREIDVLKMHFGIGYPEPMSLNAIADELGLHRERVRQIKDNALMRLRSSNRSKALKSYLAQ